MLYFDASYLVRLHTLLTKGARLYGAKLWFDRPLSSPAWADDFKTRFQSGFGLSFVVGHQA